LRDHPLPGLDIAKHEILLGCVREGVTGSLNRLLKSAVGSRPCSAAVSYSRLRLKFDGGPRRFCAAQR